MNPVETQVRRLQRKSRWAAFLGAWCRVTAVTALALGAAILIARTAFDVERGRAALGFIVFVPTTVLAWVLSGRRALSRTGAASWLDARAGATGVLVTGLEAPDERWAKASERALAASPSLPRLHIGAGLGAVAAAGLFCAATYWVRVPEPRPGPPSALLFSAVERLAGKLATLSEHVDLDPELAADLASRLERLREEVEDSNPESVFEAIDRMEERLESEAERARDDAEKALESLAESALDAWNDEETRARFEQMVAGLTEAGLLDESVLGEIAERVLGEGGAGGNHREGGAEQLAGAWQRASELLGSGEWDPAAELELSSELRDLLESKLDHLADAGLLRASELRSVTELLRLQDLDAFQPPCDGQHEPGAT